MSLEHTIKVVLSLLHHSNVPISAFLNHIFKESLVSKAENDSVYTWAFSLVKTKLAEEIVGLSGHQHGLHFNASKATSTYLDGSFMEKAAEKMSAVEPWTWSLIGKLLDANDKRRRVAPSATDEETMLWEKDWEEIGEGMMEVDRNASDSDVTEPEGEAIIQPKEEKTRKRQERARVRNAALLRIVRLILIILAYLIKSCN